MKIGISFPTLELHDPEEMKGFAQGAEQLGFHHMTALEHTLGVRTSASYTPDAHIHEPLVLFAFLAAVTRTIQFANSILILPQRQTVLVARQDSGDRRALWRTLAPRHRPRQQRGGGHRAGH